MTSSRDLAHTAVGIIGNVISFGLFLSPVPTFFRIWKKKDVEEFQYYPYVATVMNCMLWVFYGLPLVKKDNILVTTINAIGLGIELFYLAIFLRYDKNNRGRKQVLRALAIEVVAMAAVVLGAMLGLHTLKKRAIVVGVLCDILNIIMYASPLLIMRKVITTKSVEYMPFFLSLANFMNGTCWTIYALIKIDYFIIISNSLGALFGLAQLVLYACYYKSTPTNKQSGEVVKPAQVQLSGADAI